MNSRISSQASSIGILGLINVGVAILGLAQAFVVGRVFGTSNGIEVYFAASAFQQSVVSMMQTGQLVEIFTPAYHRLKAREGDLAASRLFSAFLNFLLLVSTAVALLLWILAPNLVPWIVPGFSGVDAEACGKMFQVLLPLLPFQILQSLFGAVLAAEKCFVAQEVSKFLSLLVSVAAIFFLADKFGVWIMVIALWGSVIVASGLMTLEFFRRGYHYRWVLRSQSRELFEILRRFPSLLGYVTLTQVYKLSLNATLTMLPSGSLAVFTYARKVFIRINVVLVRPISVVFFSNFSDAVARGAVEVSRLTENALRISLLAVSVVLVVVVTSSHLVLQAIWMSEDFSASRIEQTYWVLCLLCLGPIWASWGIILRKINISYQLVRKQYRMLMLAQVLSTALALAVIPMCGLWGATLVVLFNSAAFAGGSAILLRLNVPEAFRTYQVAEFAKATLAVCLPCLTVLVLQYLVSPTLSSMNMLNKFLCAAGFGSFALTLSAVVMLTTGILELRRMVDVCRNLKHRFNGRGV